MGELVGNTVVDFTIEVMREAIRTGRFAPGQRLIVSDITQEFAVSAGPVREAIRRLTGEGLVEIVPHRGASVRAVSLNDVREVYQLREAIEGAAARLAAENDDEAFREEMLALQADMAKAFKALGLEPFLDNNRRFHDLIYRMASNDRMRQLALQLMLPLYQLRLPHRMTVADMHVSYRGHQRIIAAILAGKSAAAERAMREHVAESGQGMLVALEAAEAAQSAKRRRTRAEV